MNRIFKCSLMGIVLIGIGVTLWTTPSLTPRTEVTRRLESDSKLKTMRKGPLQVPNRPAAFVSAMKGIVDPASSPVSSIVAIRESPPDVRGQIERVKITRLEFKYPLLRTVERLVRKASQGGEKIVSSQSMVADHVLVRLKPGAVEADLLELNRKFGAHIRKKMLAPNTYLVQFPNPGLDTIPDMVAQYQKEATQISYAEPDYVERALGIPEDPLFAQQWALHNTGQTGGRPDADMDAVEAWEITKGSRAVKVGVIDSGIDYTHPDLASNLWTNPREIPNNGIDDDGNGFIDDVHGWDFANDDNDPFDDRYHGTVVSGVIGARGNNGLGISGICWEVSLVPIKFLDRTGNGLDSDAIDAIYYATRLGVHLTNNSWGGGEYSEAMKEAIEDANRHGILFVAAAGNSIQDSDLHPLYPAAYDNSNIISVAATDEQDNRVWFSNWGARSVDLGAPGINILTTYLNHDYAYYLGTSLSAPQVAGVCALVKGKYSALTHLQIKEAILKSVDPIPSMAGICVSGGRLNAYQALQQASKAGFLRGVLGAGNSYSLALKDHGSVWIWGRDFSERQDLRRGLPRSIGRLPLIQQIAGGSEHGLFLSVEGSLWASGENSKGQLGDGTRRRRPEPVRVSHLQTNILEVVAGGGHSLALKEDGSVWAWGDNQYGQLGIGSRKDSAVPQPITTLLDKGITQVAAGERHSLALGDGGLVYLWGAIFETPWEPGARHSTFTPVRLEGLSHMVEVAAGGHQSLALREDGTVWTLGGRLKGSGLMDPGGEACRSTRGDHVVTPRQVSTLSEIVSIAAGSDHELALDAGGRVWVWGDNSKGQLGLGRHKEATSPQKLESISNIVEIAAGSHHSLALQSDGRIWCWGWNVQGQCGPDREPVLFTPRLLSGLELLAP